MEDLMSDARRKVKSMLRAWVAGEDLPADLAAWQDVSPF
jgi:tuftelin-interacting protein 11